MLRLWIRAALVLTALFATATMGLSREWEAPGEMDAGWQVVFTSFAFSPELIAHVMNSDGSDPQMLLLDAMPVTTPICSPNGNHFAFIAGQSIYIIRADGTELRQVYAGVSPTSARLSMSNEGNVVVFSGVLDHDGRGELATLIINAETMQTLTLHDERWFNALFFDLSPDGTQIALLTGSGDVYLASLDDKILTHLAAEATNPQWSPDGTLIAFSTIWGEYFRVTLLDINRLIQAPLTRLANYGAYDLFPAWSPNGQQILFQHIDFLDSFESSLYMMTADGSEQHPLTIPLKTVETACFLTARPASLVAGA